MSDPNTIHVQIKNELYYILSEDDHDDLYRHEFVSDMCDKFKITKSLVYREIDKAIDKGDIEYFKPFNLPFKRAMAMRMIKLTKRPRIIRH